MVETLTCYGLNVLSRRLAEATLQVSGTVTFNGSPDIRTVRHSYVMQSDCLIPTFTVRETLQYSADLRLRDSVSKEERRNIVEETILELGLKECASTRIGTSTARGCSGGELVSFVILRLTNYHFPKIGERRRTSIGIQVSHTQ
jgi:ABC-type multidrug transport system ATPase subunit